MNASSPILDLDAFAGVPLRRDPYAYLIVPDFVRAAHINDVIADFPDIETPGSLPLERFERKGAFARLIEEMNAGGLRDAVAAKFGVDLDGRPSAITLRGKCRASDGKIHTDSRTKIITLLLYLNHDWEAGGGRLRILRSGDNLKDAAAEVPPHNGTLLAFRRSERSWHGHEPFEGTRRALQMNWLTSQGVQKREHLRHTASAFLKNIKRVLSWRAT